MIPTPFLIFLLAAAMFLTHCGEREAPSESAPPEPAETAEPAPEPEPEQEPEARTEPEPAQEPEPQGPQKVRMETSEGTLVLELYPDRAPETVANFLEYVDAKFYDGTIFHRVIPNFMIQGGGFTPEMREKSTRDPIKNESDNALPNSRYSIAMARTPDPHSATAQFFINHVTNRMLDKDQARDGWGYCVFGKVVEGGDVVDEIAKAKTGSGPGGHQDVPVSPIVIRTVRREG